MHFRITNDGASVSGFTLKHGCVNDWTYAGSLHLTAGTVSNCVINGTLKTGYWSVCIIKGTAKVYDCEFDAAGYNGSSSYDSTAAHQIP